MTTRPIAARPDRVPAALGLLAILAGAGLGLLTTGIGNPLWIGAILLGTFAVIATIAHVEWGLIAIVFVTWTNFSDVLVRNHHLPSIVQPFILLLVLAILARWLLFADTPEGWGRSTGLILAYGLMGIVSLFHATDQVSAQGAIITYAKHGIIAILITILLKRGPTLKWVIWTLLAAGIFMGTLVTYQQLTRTFDKTYGGFALAPLANILAESDGFRIAGPIGDPNYFAQILVVLVPLALDRLWSERSLLLRLVALWAVLVCTLGIVFSFSRGGLLGFVFAVGVVLVRRPPRLVTLLVALGLLIGLVRFVPPEYYSRMATVTDAIPGFGDPLNEVSFRGRLSENTIALMMYADHALMGVGWNNYPDHYLAYSRVVGIDPRREEREPHNLYLEVAAESGTVGLVIFGLLILFTFRSVWQAEREFRALGMVDYAGMAGAVGVALVGYLVAGLFLHMAYPRFFYLLVGIALALPNVVAYERTKLQSAPVTALPSRSEHN